MAGNRRRPRSGGVDARTDAREQALILLYESEQRAETIEVVAETHAGMLEGMTREIAVGVEADRESIDAEIRELSRGWTLERMAAVDRAILRIGIWELRHRTDTPVAVVIDEAVELAKRFSTDDSGRFVNGVLAASSRRHRNPV